MIPQETIKNLKKLKSFHNGSYGTAIDMAIKALEQQPCEDAVSCNCTTEEVAKSFIEDVESVKDQLDGQPCADYISRTALLSRIDEERKHLLDIKMDGAEHVIVHHARRIIEDMPSVTPKASWISVSENKRPENKERCITTMRYEVSYTPPWEVVQENMWIDDGDGDAHFEQDDENVIAWMPLPKPFEAESEDKE